MLNKDCTCAIIQYCSTQDMLYMPPEYRKFRRVHGLQLPLHPQQIIGWVLLIVIFAGTFTVLLTTPLFSNLYFILLLLFATLFLLHVSTHLTVLLLDPADPEVRARPTDQIVPEFDRTKHRHVIENGRCHLCNITTYGRHTKHCSICNKCVPRFDHHCKWLNNCIGGRNYPAFLACLVSTLITALSVTALALGELVLVNVCFVVDNEHWTNNNSNSTDMNVTTPSASLPMPGTGSLILITIIGILSTIAAILLIHLCFFHGYIACLGLTTYEYVRRKRERNVTGNVISSRTASSSSLCASYYTDSNGEDINQMVNTQDLYSRLCEKGSFRVDTGTTATTDMFVCSMHEKTRRTTNGKNISMKTFSSTKSSRNFHLCFSYDARTETSIEVSSSRTTNMMESKTHKESPDAKSSSTPSPVSCCFSIMNHSENRHDRNSRKRRTSERRSETAKRSCGTMRRIQTFLQVRLRKSSKQKSMTPLSVARHCDNKVIPQRDNSPDIAPTIIEDQNQSHLVDTLTTQLGMLPYNLRPPARLPALDLPRVIHNIKGISPSSGDISIPMISSSMISKRNQTHLCTRRNASLSRKRPRFKLGSHIIAQTAQLSPIPESEFSKPATPRSPSRSSPAFIFPSLRE